VSVGACLILLVLQHLDEPSNAEGVQPQATSSQSGEVAAHPEWEARLRDLASPNWSVREEATNKLMEAGPGCYALLRQAFHSTRSHEVRRRIKRIALENYLTEHVGPPRAFLGISHRGQPVAESGDARIPGWATALYITSVFGGTAAEQAGLKSGDLVMALDGKSGTLTYPAIEFTEWIGTQTPGARCSLRVVRGGRGIKLVEGPTEGFAPQMFADVGAKFVRHEGDARVPHEGVGILLQDTLGVPAKLDVMAGDLILALNDQPIPTEKAEEHFRSWLRGELPLPPPPEKNLPPRVGLARPPRGPQAGASAQILRGGEGLNISVALGRWPRYLSGNPRRAAAVPGAVTAEQAQATFADWWVEAFDPTGEFGETVDDDARWRLEPDWGSR